MPHFLIPEISILEKIIRPAIVYFFLLLVFRFMGKRSVGQLTPFDLVVLLIISNIVQNAMIGSDNSLGGGLIGAATIFILNYIFVELAFRSKGMRRIMEARPALLIHNGRVLHDNLNRERITMDELLSAMRRAGVVEPSKVWIAVLEENGSISVIPFKGEMAS